MFRKIQDYLSVRSVGERIAGEDFRGIKADWSLVQEALDVLGAEGVLNTEIAWACPNTHCGAELMSSESGFYCDDCAEHVEEGDALEMRIFVLLETPSRSADRAMDLNPRFDRRMLICEEAKTIMGGRDDDQVYLPIDYSARLGNFLVQDGNRVLKLTRMTFQPEYGGQPRRFAYDYVVENEGGIVQNNQNVTFNGSGNSVGSIVQDNRSANTAEFAKLIADIQSAAAKANLTDPHLVNLLTQAQAGTNDKAKVVSTLRKLVEIGADYAAVIGPFMPTIAALLSGAAA
ncbi:MAG: hypothetical protein AB7F86_07250 [Bdellovibrionales bacterium]